MSEIKMSHAKTLAICAVCIAISFLLNQVSLFRMPQGGSITPASMLFVVLAGYWLGPKYGILTGVAMGLLNTVTGAYIVHPIQYVLDYLLGPAMLGLSGFFRKWKYGLLTGYVVGVFGRFVMVFLSGWIFFGILAEDMGVWPAATFSIIYNITYIGPELVATLMIISLPVMKHAIDVVTKNVVSPSDYIIMTRHKGSVTATARMVTGTVIGAMGGLAFVVASYITRLENIAISRFNTYMSMGHIMHWCYEAESYIDILVPAPQVLGTIDQRLSRLYRMLDRNTGQIMALQTIGVLFLAIGIALVVSTLNTKKEV